MSERQEQIDQAKPVSVHAFKFWRNYQPWSDESYPHASCRCGWEWEDGTWGRREDARRAYRVHKDGATNGDADHE